MERKNKYYTKENIILYFSLLGGVSVAALLSGILVLYATAVLLLMLPIVSA